MALRGVNKPVARPVVRSDTTLPNKKYDRQMPDPVEQKVRSVSMRLSEKHQNYLNDVMQVLDCDRSEAIRRAIRLLRLSLSGHNAHLHVKDRTGKLTVTPIMNDGVPI